MDFPRASTSSTAKSIGDLLGSAIARLCQCVVVGYAIHYASTFSPWEGFVFAFAGLSVLRWLSDAAGLRSR